MSMLTFFIRKSNIFDTHEIHPMSGTAYSKRPLFKFNLQPSFFLASVSNSFYSFKLGFKLLDSSRVLSEKHNQLDSLPSRDKERKEERKVFVFAGLLSYVSGAK